MNKELKEQVRKEFEEQGWDMSTAYGERYVERVLSFIDSIIDKTIQQERDRIVGKLNLMELSDKPEGYEIAVDDIISLITNNSEINK